MARKPTTRGRDVVPTPTRPKPTDPQPPADSAGATLSVFGVGVRVKPLGDKIIVQRFEAEAKTASGIYLPEGAKDKPQRAKVVRVGTGKIADDGKKIDFQVKEGDTIILGKWGGTEIKIDGIDYIVMGEDEILAIVE